MVGHYRCALHYNSHKESDALMLHLFAKFIILFFVHLITLLFLGFLITFILLVYIPFLVDFLIIARDDFREIYQLIVSNFRKDAV